MTTNYRLKKYMAQLITKYLGNVDVDRHKWDVITVKPVVEEVYKYFT